MSTITTMLLLSATTMLPTTNMMSGDRVKTGTRGTRKNDDGSQTLI